METSLSLMQATKPWIYLNGYPGVGKLTIAKELQKIIPNSKIVHNHLTIDLCRSIFPQGSHEYEALRTGIRTQILTAITSSSSRSTTSYIFTGASMTAETSKIGPTVIMHHLEYTTLYDVPFIYILVKCSEEENMKRATTTERVGKKLTDLDKLREIRESMEAFAFGKQRKENMVQLELDITAMEATEAAEKIRELASEWYGPLG